MKKTQELENLRNLDQKTLFIELKNAEKKLANLRFGVAFRKLKNYHEITHTRHRIARIWTILTSKAIERS